jgi:SAM-dependent methyltransferase
VPVELNGTRQSASTLEFYETLAGDYDKQFADWRAECAHHGRVLSALVRGRQGQGRGRILDCACGIGTQAFGLALEGHDVQGTDFCAAAIERARHEALALELDVEFRVADFRELDSAVPAGFDVVCCCDNALPHLLEDAELLSALRSMRSRLRADGLIVLSIRDYDRALEEHGTGAVPKMFEIDGMARVVFQVWDWRSPSVYRLNHFLMWREAARWETRHYVVDYRALRRRELTALLARAGFGDVRWHMPGETGFHQPLVTAVARPAG